MTSEFHRESLVKKTRGTSPCDWCGQVIPAGSRAVSVSGLFDGDFYSGRLHLECAAARNASERVREDGYEIGVQARGRTDDDTQAPPEFVEEDYFK